MHANDMVNIGVEKSGKFDMGGAAGEMYVALFLWNFGCSRDVKADGSGVADGNDIIAIDSHQMS